MTNSELLNALEQDLASVCAPKQAHIFIGNVITAYRQKVAGDEANKNAEQKMKAVKKPKEE